MQRTYRYTLLLLSIIFGSFLVTHGQGRPVGQWRSLLPYKIVTGVASDGRNVYAATEQAFFSFDAVTGDIETFSKVSGMHDVGMSAIGWDAVTSTVILAYQNSNIDLYRNHSFTNLPDLKLRSFAGSKRINHIYTNNGYAYLSTDLGIVVLNLSKPEVKETYVFSKAGQTLPIRAFTSAGNLFYAATSFGLFRANRNNPNLQAFASWEPVDTTHDFRGVVTVQGKVFVTGPDSLWQLNGNTLQGIYSSQTNTRHLDAGKEDVYVTVFFDSLGYGLIKRINANTLATTDSFKAGRPAGVAETAIGEAFVADLYNGLNQRYTNTRTVSRIPNGPSTFTAFDIWANNGELWIAHGAVTDKFGPTFNRSGISHLLNGNWTPYSGESYPLLDSVQDFIDIEKDPLTGDIYGGTLRTGLLQLHPDGSGQLIKQGVLGTSITEPGVYAATSVAFDKNGNLWVTNSGAPNELAVRTPSGQWYHYGTPFPRTFPKYAAGLVIDDDNQKWFFPPQGGGVIVYNDNNTPETGSDDAFAQIGQGKGSGNLPSNIVRCLAKDRNNAIWVGTDNGIGIINCASTAAMGGCEAEQRIVQYDQFAGYLFAGEQVRTIAVDGANRKWIGTTNGVWLISPDADKVILRFTIDNSPLPSNIIEKISIDPFTGDVYFGTDLGLVSYRGTATEGATSNQTPLLTFPNPVPSGYTGTVAIRGLVEDADVRITDISGQLIYRTKALGGQAVWDGRDYHGHRPESGVLLIFATNKDGTQTATGKMIYQH